MAGELILVVDDEENIRDIVAHILKSAGYKPVVTGDPEEALSIAREVTPGVILLDVMMPRMDGFDVCQMLRDHADTEKVPIVFLTALGHDVSKERGRVSGGTLYLQKPFTKETVLSAVGEALGFRQKEKKRSPTGWAKAISMERLRRKAPPS